MYAIILYNELCSFSKLSVPSPSSQLILQLFCHFAYVTAHSPTLLLLHPHDSSFSNPSFASPTSQALHLCHLASCPCWHSDHWSIQDKHRSMTESLLGILSLVSDPTIFAIVRPMETNIHNLETRIEFFSFNIQINQQTVVSSLTHSLALSNP